MSHDAELPSTYSDAARGVLATLIWVLPLISAEAFLLHGEPTIGAVTGILWVVAIIVAVKLHVFAALMSNREKRRVILVWAAAIGVAAAAGFGAGWWYFSRGVRIKTYSLVPTKSVIRVTGTRPFLRNKENGLPFSVNIYAIADEPLTEVFMQDDLLTPITEITPELMKSNFETLRILADIASDKAPELGMVTEPKTERFRTVSRKVFTDDTVEAVLKGTQRLYVIALWKYKLQGSSDFNVKYLCVYYINTFDNTKTCPGPYNGTFAYKEQ
jgi:hypothetical protein